MCGIVVYRGGRPALSFLLTGLGRLEYRGYDSAGVALIGADQVLIEKAVGKLQNLKAKLAGNNFHSSLGFAHTRWATHGGATENNAHPHVSSDGDLIAVHNGVIENYLILKQKLESVGYRFYSETDTEVAINFIDWIREEQKLDLVSAVQIALEQIAGTCVLVIYSKSAKELIAVNKGGQLFGGLEGDECFIASDKVAFAGFANDFFEIKSGTLLLVKEGEKPVLLNPSRDTLIPFLEKIDIDLTELELGEFPNFMLKEIFSQPQIIRDGLAGRVDFESKTFCFGGLDYYWPQIRMAERLTIVACGTSYYAGLLGKCWLESLAGISVKVEYASEFQPAVIKAGDLVLGISQSGTTADTLTALDLAKERGAIVLGICNVVGSPIARLTHAGIYTRAGVENGVASTKAFMAQILALLLISLKLGADKGLKVQGLVDDLKLLPILMEKVLETNSAIEKLAEKFKDSLNCLYLGRGYNYPIALEGALKLKELSYIHAEGMPSGESKHGPLALIDEKMPVVMIATQGEFYGKVINNLAEIKARGGKVICLVNEGDSQVVNLADELIILPDIGDILSPFINVISLQLLAYHLAKKKGCDVDRPRNLAKSVTVE